jgi:hypothetical protein
LVRKGLVEKTVSLLLPLGTECFGTALSTGNLTGEHLQDRSARLRLAATADEDVLEPAGVRFWKLCHNSSPLDFGKAQKLPISVCFAIILHLWTLAKLRNYRFLFALP